MIELTVKTLDSQNHAFSVPDDTTVKQLKEKIAESISFPIESQRLIYCGRVLQDDKNLSEYDVNGKVIHLVQRPPPQVSRPNGGQGGARSGSGQQQRRSNHHFRQPRIDGNAMYLGAMAFPADLMDAQGIQAPPSSHSLSLSRLMFARRMLRRAEAVLFRLEHAPTQENGDTETPPDDAENANGTNGENGAGSSTGSGPQVLSHTLPFTGSMAHAAQAATAAAIAAAVSAAHSAGVPSITIVRGGQQQNGSESVDVRIEGTSVTVEENGPDQDVTVSSSDIPMQDASSSSDTAEAAEATSAPQAQETTPESGAAASGSTSSEERVPVPPEFPRTSTVAGLLDDLENINRRLQPFMSQYHQLMQDDPAYEPNAPSIRESQRVFSLVSEVMHFLSHAYHALSDIMCDFSQAPPRSLRCRPVLIQHSAVLQAGIPIQAQINVMTNRGNSNNGSSNNTSSSNTEQERSNQSGATAEPVAATAAAAAASASTTSDNGQAQANEQEQPARAQQEGQEATFNLTPGNVEFFMEVGPGSITIDSLEATVVTNGNASGIGSGGIEANVVGGSFPWGTPPPPEFIQNLMQAVAGHMIGRGGNTTSSGTTNTGGTGTTGVGVGTGQNSQARGNTATHPTTATQTRSTSRPHVHLAPAMQGLGASNFDPFLPCNSHHIRSRTRPNLASFQQQFVASSSTEPQAQTPSSDHEQPSQEQQQEASSQTQPQARRDPELLQNASPCPYILLHSHARPQSQSQAQAQAQQPHPPPQQSQAQPMQAPPQQQQQQQQQQQTPNQQQQQSSNQQQQRRPNEQSAQSLFDMISSMFNNMPATAGTSINFGPLYQSPPQPRPPSSGTHRSTGTSTGPTSLPPGVAMFMNLMNGQGNMGAGESHPFAPVLAQMFEGVTGALGGAILGQGSGTTLADFLQSLPDHSYVEGNSLFADFIMTLARSMTFQDLIALSFGSGEVLNRLRPQLREFISQRVLMGEPADDENISRGVDRLIRELRPCFDVMLQARLRDDVDLITTSVRYNQIRLPEVINLIMVEGNEHTFGGDMVRWCTTYIREMTAIIRYCCLDDMQGLDLIMRNYVQQLTQGVHPSVQQWTVTSTLVHMRNYVSRQNVPLEDIQRFLVYRIPSSTQPLNTQETAPPTQQPAAPVANEEGTPEPMEMDANPSEPISVTSAVPAEQPPAIGITMDTENLPDVVLGSEAWHNVLPSEWVPIIARDTQRHRRQSTQPAFSDAYLSGMPSKRRKVVSSAKPQGNISQVITDSIRHSLDDAGIRPVNGVETAGDDLELQAAYREQMRSSVQDNLINNPDFTPDRFPNATKYFSK